MKAILIMISAAMIGCAASPYAWRDLGDGMGMRGWAGIPLQQSVPYALGSGLNQFGQSVQATRQPIPRFGTFQSADGRFGTYYETGGY